MKTLPLIFAAFSALMPVITQKTGLSSKYGFKIKMLCAFMYLATGVLSAVALYRVTLYSLLILTALIFGILGDFFLSYKEDRYFPVGILFFALGHIVYSVTFLLVGEMRAIDYIVPVLILTMIMFIPIVFIIKVKIDLGKLEIPILIYGLILLFFFVCGVTKGIIAIRAGNLSFGLCMILGASLFIASDIMLGLKSGGMELPEILRHAVTYTYFPAQTLFALSIYFQ